MGKMKAFKKDGRFMEEELLRRIEILEYHQRLLLNLLGSSERSFTKMIILKNLEEKEVREFHELCDELSIKMQEQKAEGFVYFLPLFQEFSNRLNKKLEAEATVKACLEEKIHLELMSEFQKFLID